MRTYGAIVLAVATLLAAGCGGGDGADTDAAFKAGATAATTKTSAIGEDLGKAIQGAKQSTDDALAAEFTGLTARARNLVAELGALDPPADAKPKVDALAAALTKGATDLEAVAKALTAHDVEGASSATQSLIADSPAIKTANDALKAELKIAES